MSEEKTEDYTLKKIIKVNFKFFNHQKRKEKREKIIYFTNVGSPSAPNNCLMSEVTICFNSFLEQKAKGEVLAM